MLKVPIVVILRGIEEIHLFPIADSLIHCGIDTVEITMNTKNATDLISKLVAYSGNKLTVGAGTVLTTNQLDDALKVGASFIVTPVVNIEVIKACSNQKIPIFPGTLTPSEVYSAWEYGASMVKIFPANVFGPQYFKDLHGPFNNIKLMAVGGVNKENINAFFNNGASAVAIGGSIFSKQRLDNKEYINIEKDLKELISLIPNKNG